MAIGSMPLDTIVCIGGVTHQGHPGQLAGGQSSQIWVGHAVIGSCLHCDDPDEGAPVTDRAERASTGSRTDATPCPKTEARPMG